jgi:hypothetical protein
VAVQYLIFSIEDASMTILKMTLALLFALTFNNSVAATLLYSTENGAIDGYDPVSYFEDGRAERGSADITAQWNGAVWPTNPEAWTIHEGKLYLNMIKEVTITWRYNPDKLIERANLKWKDMNSD